MIELKHLSQEERTLITIQCNSFFIHYNKNKKLNKVYKSLMEELPDNMSKEVWMVITATASSLFVGGNGSLLSLRKSVYASANKIHKQKISYVRTLKLLPLLEELGYITMYKGFYDKKEDVAIQSCFLFSDKLVSLFNAIELNGVVKKPDKSLLVEVKDSKTKQLITNLKKLKGIKDERELVAKYNHLLSQHDIRVKGRKAVVSYKRVYTDTLSLAGRWYTNNSFQTTKKTLRQHITINGMQCTEVDYKEVHARIIYALEGIALPEGSKPYSVREDIIKGGSAASQRALCKFALMCLLNSYSRASAIRAIRYGVYKDSTSSTPTFSGISMKSSKEVETLLSALEETNKNISHWFYTDMLWAKLQGYDSKIAEYILSTFIENSKPILCWHDSFVVRKEDRALLIGVMKDAWESCLNTSYNFAVSIEF